MRYAAVLLFKFDADSEEAAQCIMAQMVDFGQAATEDANLEWSVQQIEQTDADALR